LKKRLESLTKKRAAAKHSVVTYKECFELLKNVSVKLRETHDIPLLDQILRKFFSNFTVKLSGIGKKQRCEITHILNEPFAGFVKSDNFDGGRGERTQTFDLPVPNRTRYQLRHTPMSQNSKQIRVEVKFWLKQL
jgi:hypothetical protein